VADAGAAMSAALDAYGEAMAVALDRRRGEGRNPATYHGSPEHDEDRRIALVVAQAAAARAYDAAG